MTRARNEHEPEESPGEAIAPDQVRSQLARILASGDFARSERLAQFLTFVVEEALAGRSDRLKGRIIGQDVFGRGENFDPQSDTIVRVEAGRLRRQLREYYAAEGRDDPIQIGMPKGGYAPVFEPTASPTQPTVDTPSPTSAAAMSRWTLTHSLIITAALALVVLGGGLWFLLAGRGPTPDIHAAQRFTDDREAYALFLETRRVSRPPSNRQRVEAALDLAREVVALDPDFGGGYAAEAFLLWSYVVFGHSQVPEEDAARALELAEKAVVVQPTFGWGYQSLSRARHLTGDLDGAIVAAQQAVELQPNVAELQGNLGVILIFVGWADEAIAPLKEAIRLAGNDARVPYRNYIAMAYFHAGRPDDTIAALETNRDLGGPLGPHMHAYAAAAYAELGQFAKARVAAADVQAASAAFSVERWVERVLVDAAARRQLFSALEKAGLKAKEG